MLQFYKNLWVGIEHMRILIIEDEVTLNKMLAEGLKEYGYQSDVVETLKDGEYYLDIRNYDLVLMDWMLPDGNGVDIISDIKSKTPKTVVVVLSLEMIMKVR